MFGRSRATDGEAEIGTSRVRKRAKKGRETADAGSEPSRRRVVTGGFGRLAADRKAPHAIPSSKCLLRYARSFIQKSLCGNGLATNLLLEAKRVRVSLGVRTLPLSNLSRSRAR